MVNNQIDNYVKDAKDKYEELLQQKTTIVEKLDSRTKPYVNRSGELFINYDREWSVNWFINTFITTKWRRQKISDSVLKEMYEAYQDDFFNNLLEYRKICKNIKALASKKKNTTDKSITKTKSKEENKKTDGLPHKINELFADDNKESLIQAKATVQDDEDFLEIDF
jgi:hypothetical protein